MKGEFRYWEEREAYWGAKKLCREPYGAARKEWGQTGGTEVREGGGSSG